MLIAARAVRPLACPCIDASRRPEASRVRRDLRCVHGHDTSHLSLSVRARPHRRDRQHRLRRHAARRDDRQHRARASGRRPASAGRRPAVGRRRLYARVRGADAVGRRTRRSLRRAPNVCRGPRAVRARIARLRRRRRARAADRGPRAAGRRRGGDAAEFARTAQRCMPARSTPACTRRRLVDGCGLDLDRGRPGHRRPADRGVGLARHLSREPAAVRGRACRRVRMGARAPR